MKLGVAPELAKKPFVSLDTCPSTWGSLECFCVFNFCLGNTFFLNPISKGKISGGHAERSQLFVRNSE